MNKLMTIAIAILAIAAPSFAGNQPAATTFETLMTHYEAIRLSLVNDTTKGIETHAGAIAKLAGDVTKTFAPASVGVDASKKDECIALMPKIRKEALTLAGASDLASSRDAFFALSKSFVALKGMSSANQQPTTYYCSMAKRSWLQKADEVGNPYYGQKMAKCGQKVAD